MLVFDDSSSRVAEIKSQLTLRYKMKDLGRVSWYLGVDVVHTTTGRIFLHQTNYNTALLSECKSDIESISLPTDLVLEAYTSTPHVDGSKYCYLVGKLIFLCHTWPDISYAVGFLSRFMHNHKWLIGMQFNIYFDTSMALWTMAYFTRKKTHIFKAILMQITLVVLTTVDLLELICLSLQAVLYLGHRSNSSQCLIAQLKLNTRPYKQGTKRLCTSKG